jgi:hypothetical protein
VIAQHRSMASATAALGLAVTLAASAEAGSLIAHWKLDETSGTIAADSSGNGNNGTLTGMDPGSDWIDGQINGALDFDGTDEPVEVPDHSSLDITGAITLCAWTNVPDLTGSFARVISKKYRYGSLSGYDLACNPSAGPFVNGSTNAAQSRGSTSGNHLFKTIIVDAADDACRTCSEHVCAKHKIEHESDLGYGKGFALVNAESYRVLNKLSVLPHGLYLLCHSQEKDVETRAASQRLLRLPTATILLTRGSRTYSPDNTMTSSGRFFACVSGEGRVYSVLVQRGASSPPQEGWQS